MYYIGLMSGTSADAIDAVILEVSADGRPRHLVGSHQEPLPAELRAAIHQFDSPSNDELERMGTASVRLGRLFARAAEIVLERTEIARSAIRAIGSHGQTIRHKPDRSEPYTLQIGDPAIIVEQTGITTVANFRSRDLAAGGEGAPLVPAFHEAAFRSSTAPRAIVNLGGIANATFLPADSTARVTGFDVGPGNVLLDQWIHKHQHQPFDRNGDWARSGRVDPDLVKRLLADPYFSRRPPKSTGREYFHLEWLAAVLGNKCAVVPEDVQASLVRLTAESVADALTQHVPRPREVYLCGGGAKNAFLVDALAARLAPIPVGLTDALGFPAQWVEAAAFAWLAHQTLEGRPGNIPSVTGARHPVVLGAIYKA
jgi:anhydro-N-acetylmuramic acid kinase